MTHALLATVLMSQTVRLVNLSISRTSRMAIKASALTIALIKWLRAFLWLASVASTPFDLKWGCHFQRSKCRLSYSPSTSPSSSSARLSSFSQSALTLIPIFPTLFWLLPTSTPLRFKSLSLPLPLFLPTRYFSLKSRTWKSPFNQLIQF